MPVGTTLVLLALGLLATVLAGATPRRSRPGTPDDGPLGLGAGRTARCPACQGETLELVSISTSARPLPRVRCAACRSTYAVRGTLASVPAQRSPAA